MSKTPKDFIETLNNQIYEDWHKKNAAYFTYSYAKPIPIYAPIEDNWRVSDRPAAATEKADRYAWLGHYVTSEDSRSSPDLCRYRGKSLPEADILMQLEAPYFRSYAVEGKALEGIRCRIRSERMDLAVARVKRTRRAWPECHRGGVVSVQWTNRGLGHWGCTCRRNDVG